ncbi:MAG: flagellar biosynthetic protein FliQ [Phycisphaeraceae bacterium]|nr:flagellar biosynthetic protein FliQ [Phycisphaeraceae bacterium]
MTPDTIMGQISAALTLAATLAAPLLLVIAGAALLVGLLQGATQVHEPTLAGGPKLLALAGVLMLLGAAALRELVQFMINTLQSLIDVP